MRDVAFTKNNVRDRREENFFEIVEYAQSQSAVVALDFSSDVIATRRSEDLRVDYRSRL